MNESTEKADEKLVLAIFTYFEETAIPRGCLQIKKVNLAIMKADSKAIKKTKKELDVLEKKRLLAKELLELLVESLAEPK